MASSLNNQNEILPHPQLSRIAKGCKHDLLQTISAAPVEMWTSPSNCGHVGGECCTSALLKGFRLHGLAENVAFGALHAMNRKGDVDLSPPAYRQSFKGRSIFRAAPPERFLIRAGAMMEVTTNQNPAVMAPLRTRICAHVPCLCTVPDEDEFCGPTCRDAAREDAKIACQCDHITCPQPNRPLVVSRVYRQSL